MADVSMITGFLMNWVVSPIIWVIAIMGILVFAVGMLWVRKQRRLNFKVIELVDHGGGKFGFNNCKAGWFGKKLMLNGLWWTGDAVLRLATGEQIYHFSTNDYQEVNGKRGIVCFRDPKNQDILVPVNNCNISNLDLIADIAPASYRDAAADIFKETILETSDWKERVMQVVVYALVIGFALVSLLVVIHFIKESQAKAAELLMQAGKQGIANCKTMCAEIVNVARGNSP